MGESDVRYLKLSEIRHTKNSKNRFVRIRSGSTIYQGEIPKSYLHEGRLPVIVTIGNLERGLIMVSPMKSPVLGRDNLLVHSDDLYLS